MKLTKKIGVLLLAFAMLCVSVLGTACGKDGSGKTEDEADKTPVYKVTVKDSVGNTYGDGVIVQFFSGDKQVAMQVCDENGVAEKELDAGDYTVKLNFTGDPEVYTYDDSDLKLTAEKTELTILLSYKIVGEPTVLHAQSETYDAYGIGVGCTEVTLEAGKMNYFLFTPTEAATYEFSVIDDKATLGYYGAPHYVQAMPAIEAVDGVTSISVEKGSISTDGGGTSVLVLGVEAPEGVDECIISIRNAGAPGWSYSDVPEEIYKTTANLSKYTLPAGASIGEFDLTASTEKYNIVYNKNDGFYHLDSENGPLVLVRIAEDCKYLACFKTMLDRSGINKYSEEVDENGHPLKKIVYDNCLLEYIECADENAGVYPLTEDLKHIITERGNYVGWWDPESASYCFEDENGVPMNGINHEIAWLLFCCYIEG